MRKICVITGTRAEYGVLKPLLERVVKKTRDLKLQLVVCGMHLMPCFGSSVNIIKKDGFKIAAKLDIFTEKETSLAMADSLARAVSGFARIFLRLKPSLLVLEADRIEMLAAGLAAQFLNIPTVHISGGDVSGGLDDAIRHTLTRFSHLHLVNTKASMRRLIKMGEEPWRVRYVGTLAVSKEILSGVCPKRILADKFSINFDAPLFLVIQHPVVSEQAQAVSQIRQTLEAIRYFKEQTIIFYPNCDLGGQSMIKEITRRRNLPFLKIIKNIERQQYLGFIKYASVVIGNSSSGIVEAPFFGTPVVNIGTRQNGRERAGNCLDVGYQRDAIIKAIKKFKQHGFKKIFKNNPYRDAHTEEKIVEILRTIKIDERFLQKKLVI